MEKQKIVFRADGSLEVGLGHISRCIALVELLSEQFETTFITRAPEQFTLEVLEKLCDRVIVLKDEQSDQELSDHLYGDELVVLDGYNFSTRYEQNVKDKAAAVVTIDDIPKRHFVADAVINFCGAVDPKSYSKEFYTQLNLGAQYVFLRPPFLRVTVSKSRASNRLLINMGGADISNETQRIINQLLVQGVSIPIDVIVGPSYSFSKPLAELIKPYPFIELQQSLDAQQMFEVMSRCTMAILPPSTVALEFLSTGGILFLRKTAENQSCILKYLLEERAAFTYDDFFKQADQTQFNPKPIFQSGSLDAVKKIFHILGLSSQLKFRKMRESDVKTVFKWASDPESRRFSYSKEEIKWEAHVKWFINRLSDISSHYYLIELGGGPIGQIRFDYSPDRPDTFTISYLIDSGWRGKGLGSAVLIKGIQNLRKEANAAHIIGFVQINNVGSIKAFERAGFQRYMAEEYPDSYKFELSFKNKYEQNYSGK